MNENWIDVYKTIVLYNNTKSNEEDRIKNKYKKKMEKLEIKEKEELKNLYLKTELETNKNHYDLNVNSYILYYYLGKAIGKKIKIKPLPQFYDIYADNIKNNDFDDVFEYMCVDRREGIHYFVSSKNSEFSIFPVTIIERFEYEVIESYDDIKDVHLSKKLNNNRGVNYANI